MIHELWDLLMILVLCSAVIIILLTLLDYSIRSTTIRNTRKMIDEENDHDE